MSSHPRARAPQTAHLRTRLRRGIAKNAPKLTARKNSHDSELRESFDHCWVDIPRSDSLCKETTHESVVRFDDTLTPTRAIMAEDDEGVERLCRVLQQISDDFEKKGRPYVSMASRAAITLVRNGRQDEINSGLWRYILQYEKSAINVSVQD